MELGVGRSDGLVKVVPHAVLVDIRCLFGQLVRDQVNQVLHEVALGHEEVLADVGAVLLQLVLGEEDVEELLVGLLVGRLHPLLQLVYVKVVLLSLKWRLQTNIEDPVVFVAAAADKIHCLACLQNLVRQVVCQEGRNHDIIEAVLLGPELVVAHIRVRLDEKLLKRVVDLSRHHPNFNHRQDRR